MSSKLLFLAMLMFNANTVYAMGNIEVVGMLEGYVKTCDKRMTPEGRMFIGKAIIEFNTEGDLQQRANSLRKSRQYKRGKSLVTSGLCPTVGFLLQDMGLSKATTSK